MFVAFCTAKDLAMTKNVDKDISSIEVFKNFAMMNAWKSILLTKVTS